MENKKRFIDLFFNENEEICVSANKYGTYSVPRDKVLSGPIINLKSCGKNETVREFDSNYLSMCAINPISGSRKDANVTAYRSFLIEIDDLPIPDQVEYIKQINLPYSICVFSGNKSLHFGIVLSEDLPSDEYWRFLNQWILNVVEFADQQTKNPSRSIRFPDMIRDNGKVQKCLKINKRLSLNELLTWLGSFEEEKPVISERREFDPATVSLSEYKSIPTFIMDKLNAGVDFGRNQEWFNISCVLAKKMWEEEEVVELLGNYFVEEPDFKYDEWRTCIKSAFKTIYNV